MWAVVLEGWLVYWNWGWKGGRGRGDVPVCGVVVEEAGGGLEEAFVVW